MCRAFPGNDQKARQQRAVGPDAANQQIQYWADVTQKAELIQIQPYFISKHLEKKNQNQI